MKILQINPLDNVAVCLSDVRSGETVEAGRISLTAKSDIPSGHKICVHAVDAGENVIKYGHSIGSATSFIAPGEWVHTHNLKTNLSGIINYSYNPKQGLAAQSLKTDKSFMGFKRASGSGIRNEIWIVPTVGCMNSVADIIEKRAQSLIKGSVSGVYSFKHPHGCSQLGEDHENTKRALCGLICHPNAGGVLVLGLGCENNGIEGMRSLLEQNGYDASRVLFLKAQDSADEISDALELIGGLIDRAAADKREPRPVSELVVGLKCGGSDGFSGITANPLVGAFTDMLIANGGSAILTEVPEMFGAETILMERCASNREFDKTVAMINGFKEYYMRYNQVIYENPSPGNKEGGITTLEEKSLGCTMKSGFTPVTDVLSYGQRLNSPGLNLLSSPGNDLVASTAVAVSGAHIVLFTTGRGTPFGCPVPTVKISSNTSLFNAKPHWMDFDAGVLATGQPMDEAAAELYRYVIRLASGEIETKTEQHGIRDIAVFKDGVTL